MGRWGVDGRERLSEGGDGRGRGVAAHLLTLASRDPPHRAPTHTPRCQARHTRTHPTHTYALQPLHKMAASAPAYLKAFVESVAELPAELRRTFQLMRELDAKAAAMQRQADLDARTCLLSGGKVREERERAVGCETESWRCAAFEGAAPCRAPIHPARSHRRARAHVGAGGRAREHAPCISRTLSLLSFHCQADAAAAASPSSPGGKRTTREAELQAMRERLDADMKQVCGWRRCAGGGRGARRERGGGRSPSRARQPRARGTERKNGDGRSSRGGPPPLPRTPPCARSCLGRRTRTRERDSAAGEAREQTHTRPCPSHPSIPSIT